MLPAPDARTRLNAIDADIAEVVRLIAEKNLSIKLGDHEASGAENQAHEMRAVLEQLLAATAPGMAGASRVPNTQPDGASKFIRTPMCTQQPSWAANKFAVCNPPG
jgi:hypothetical protein